MTDNEISKALELLEFCKSLARHGEDVLLNPDTIFSIDKIIKSKDKQLEAVKLMHINDVKKKDAEIERLQNERIERIRELTRVVYDKEIAEIKSEAYKEFAERLTDRICENVNRSLDNPNGNNYYPIDVYKDIDNLLAEMESEGK